MTKVIQIHTFKDSLARSQANVDASWWESVYKTAFPNMTRMAPVLEDGWAQRGGIDRIVVLASGRIIYVDEKVRERDYGDIALEYWSSRENKKPGWVAQDLACDFIAYAVPKAGLCYMIQFHLLRAAWKAHCRDWVSRFPKVEAENQGYTTVSCPVPVDVLLNALRDAMVVPMGEGA